MVTESLYEAVSAVSAGLVRHEDRTEPSEQHLRDLEVSLKPLTRGSLVLEQRPSIITWNVYNVHLKI